MRTFSFALCSIPVLTKRILQKWLAAVHLPSSSRPLKSNKSKRKKNYHKNNIYLALTVIRNPITSSLKLCSQKKKVKHKIQTFICRKRKIPSNGIVIRAIKYYTCVLRVVRFNGYGDRSRPKRCMTKVVTRLGPIESYFTTFYPEHMPMNDRMRTIQTYLALNKSGYQPRVGRYAGKKKGGNTDGK